MTVEPFLSPPPTLFDVVLGRVDGMSAVIKFGFTDDADTGEDTDLWDGASLPLNQSLYIPPTAARIHQIVSDNAGDAAAGVGARTVVIQGLQGWTTAETSETVTMNGLTNVPTVKSYVVINRMSVATHGATSMNEGIITATADVDGTLSAQIRLNAAGNGIGYTQSTIHGFPSTQSAFFIDYYGTGVRAAQSLSVVPILKADLSPDLFQNISLAQHIVNAQTDGSSYVRHEFLLQPLFIGPKLFKLSTQASANNTSVAGGYNFVLVNNDLIDNLIPS